MSSMSLYLLVVLAFVTLAYGVYWMFKPLWTSPSLRLCGPPSQSLLLGHQYDISKVQNTEHEWNMYSEWASTYGPVAVWRDLFNKPAPLVTDLKALTCILSRTSVYQKSDALRVTIRRYTGDGVLITEGDIHRAQRKLMNPAFGPGQIRNLTGIFLDKANELRIKWTKESESRGGKALDVILDVSATTLDVIGLAGFDYNFNSLSGDGNELAKASAQMTVDASTVTIWQAAEYFFPALLSLPTEHNQEVKRVRVLLDCAGREALAKKKRETREDDLIGKGHRARDLISLLVQANQASNEAQRISDEDILAQIPTFLLAGQDTTSTCLSWMIFELGVHLDLQDRLRAELQTVRLSTDANGNDPLTAEELSVLDKLPLLDAVVRETNRLHPPVPMSNRVALADDAVPVSQPYTDRFGTLHDTVLIQKGDEIHIPIVVVNRSKVLWGPDAREWKPERWLNGVPDAVKAIPNVYGPMLTFGAGSHACIGHRFAIVELKIILHTLITGLQFKLAVDASEIGEIGNGIVARPGFKDAREKGATLPMIVSRVP